jgi:hypothetical protein
MLTGITRLCTFSSLRGLYWTILPVNHQHAYRYHKTVYLFIPQRPLLNHPACKLPTCLQVSQDCVPFHPSEASIEPPFCKPPTCLQDCVYFTSLSLDYFLYTTNLIRGVTGMCTYFLSQPSMVDHASCGRSTCWHVGILRMCTLFLPQPSILDNPSWRPSTFLPGIQRCTENQIYLFQEMKIAQPCSQFLH